MESRESFIGNESVSDRSVEFDIREHKPEAKEEYLLREAYRLLRRLQAARYGLHEETLTMLGLVEAWFGLRTKVDRKAGMNIQTTGVRSGVFSHNLAAAFCAENQEQFMAALIQPEMVYALLNELQFRECKRQP